MNTSTSQNVARIGQRVASQLHAVIEYLLLRRIFAVEIAIFGLGMLAGVYIIFAIWWYEPPRSLRAPSSATQLSTAKIDGLELWIEERQQELQTPLNLTRRDYFAEKASP